MCHLGGRGEGRDYRGPPNQGGRGYYGDSGSNQYRDSERRDDYGGRGSYYGSGDRGGGLGGSYGGRGEGFRPSGRGEFRGGGRGGSSAGGGGRGTRHMGELPSVRSLLDNSSIADNALTPILRPSAEDLVRPITEDSVALPRPEAWRFIDTVIVLTHKRVFFL